MVPGKLEPHSVSLDYTSISEGHRDVSGGLVAGDFQKHVSHSSENLFSVRVTCSEELMGLVNGNEVCGRGWGGCTVVQSWIFYQSDVRDGCNRSPPA